MISAANEFIYIETQYLIGSGDEWGSSTVKNGIPAAIVKRILEKAHRQEPFHTYIVLPMVPEGVPTSTGMVGVRDLQWKTMGWMVKTLDERLGQNWSNYLSFCYLGQWAQVAPYNPTQVRTRKVRLTASRRYMIYVHSKLMIVDDRCVILGSANLNERSLAGDRDTEICVCLRPDQNKDTQAKVQVARFRRRLWEEHLGSGWEASLEQPANMNAALAPGSLACVKMVQDVALRNYLRFLNGQRDGTEGHLMLWPLAWSKDQLMFGNLGFGDDRTSLIPDYDEAEKQWFTWVPPRGSALGQTPLYYLFE